MTILHKMYGLVYDAVNGRSCRAKLKSMIITEFKDKLLFLTVYAQTPVRLCVAHPDGARRKTTKSPVINVINNRLNSSETPAWPPASDNSYMACLVAIIPAPTTYSDLAKAILHNFHMVIFLQIF